ncbi:hypothetical protein IX306_000652 [Porphyromonas levii]|nr:hypothetical protein [Porphyromonas levii]MBR8773541.1 hypothetical protein [Porphyromonas levii]MBR8801777.1 hypothetical protein [Porphyromonas levii]
MRKYKEKKEFLPYSDLARTDCITLKMYLFETYDNTWESFLRYWRI